jgi:hypothetical protein
MDMRKILIQLDSDPQASVFDRVVAVDGGADEVFTYAGVKVEQVRDLVHGAIFTRSPEDLKSTALFVGGSDVSVGEKIMQQAVQAMLPQFGLRVSILLDANGANTTAAAAVRAASRHIELKGAPALVLGGTGPVGQRVVRLLARQGAHVRVGSRQTSRSAAVCENLRARIPGAHLEACGTGGPTDLAAAMRGRILVIAAGAAGAVLLPQTARMACSTLKVAIDLNAVPPLGIEGVGVGDKAEERDGNLCFGAVGVGKTKMKIHKAAIARLFESNNQILDAEEVYQIASGF